jgi:hypothetical protein
MGNSEMHVTDSVCLTTVRADLLIAAGGAVGAREPPRSIVRQTR